MKKRFRILRIVIVIYKVLAWLVLIGGTLASMGIAIMGIVGGLSGMGELGREIGAAGALGGIAGGLGAFVITLIYFLFIYAGAEFVTLFLAIEENTRITAEGLRGQGAPAAGFGQPTPGT